MKMLSKFSRMERHNNTIQNILLIILQCIQGLKAEVYTQPDIF